MPTSAYKLLIAFIAFAIPYVDTDLDGKAIYLSHVYKGNLNRIRL